MKIYCPAINQWNDEGLKFTNQIQVYYYLKFQKIHLRLTKSKFQCTRILIINLCTNSALTKQYTYIYVNYVIEAEKQEALNLVNTIYISRFHSFVVPLFVSKQVKNNKSICRMSIVSQSYEIIYIIKLQ